MVCVDLVGPLKSGYQPKHTLFHCACTNNDRSSITTRVDLKLSKPQISQHYKYPSSICSITPGWHVTRNLNLLSLTMGVGANSNVTSNKCVCKTIMALKPNQLQVTTKHPQANAIIEQVHKVISCQLCAQII
jgi:hypothetical protein